jgi:hypothetical protein
MRESGRRAVHHEPLLENHLEFLAERPLVSPLENQVGSLWCPLLNPQVNPLE